MQHLRIRGETHRTNPKRWKSQGSQDSCRHGIIGTITRRRSHTRATFLNYRASYSIMNSLIIVVSGPGGVGKSTIVEALVRRDDRLWLSRSWTTRERRPGEAADAYVFVTREQFQQRITNNGFLEWTEFIGNMYGTPNPEAPIGRDIVLEIEVDGASQVKKMHPDAVLLFVLPPTREEQRARLQGRGDVEQKVEQRLQKAEDEEPIGKALADYVLINDDLSATIDEMLELINAVRAKRA
jgi:guanylate kinase